MQNRKNSCASIFKRLSYGVSALAANTLFAAPVEAKDWTMYNYYSSTSSHLSDEYNPEAPLQQDNSVTILIVVGCLLATVVGIKCLLDLACDGWQQPDNQVNRTVRPR